MSKTVNSASDARTVNNMCHELSLSTMEIEEAVMWAVKHLTR